jgi:hypothetical protein
MEGEKSRIKAWLARFQIGRASQWVGRSHWSSEGVAAKLFGDIATAMLSQEASETNLSHRVYHL